MSQACSKCGEVHVTPAELQATAKSYGYSWYMIGKITGYGRSSISQYARSISPISCHASKVLRRWLREARELPWTDYRGDSPEEQVRTFERLRWRGENLWIRASAIDFRFVIIKCLRCNRLFVELRQRQYCKKCARSLIQQRYMRKKARLKRQTPLSQLGTTEANQ